MRVLQPAQVALQCRDRDASACFLLEGGCQAGKGSVLIGGNEGTERLLFGGAHGPGSAWDRSWLQVLLLAPLASQAPNACQRDTESVGDLTARLPLLQSIDHALTKIQGESFHGHSIAENQPFQEGL